VFGSFNQNGIMMYHAHKAIRTERQHKSLINLKVELSHVINN